MIGLLIDSILFSITHFETCFLIFDLKNKNIIYYILTSIITAYLMQSIIGFIYVFTIYIINKILGKYTKKYFIISFIEYILLFNIKINIVNFICFTISVLILEFNPYN